MDNQRPLLIIDDNEGVFESLELNFQRDGLACVWAADRGEALAQAERHDVLAAIIDLSLGGESGLDVMRDLLAVRPGLPVIFISGYGTLEAAVSAVKIGAYDFLPKPVNFKKLRKVLAEAVAGTENPGGTPVGPGEKGIVHAPGGAVARILEKAEKIADSDLPILISGESGAGKELLAEFIHARSHRAAKPFVRINCSAINETLAESELFGHVKGAFTGATADRAGFFRQADGGSIHLDEIGDMSPSNQARILRVLEEGTVRPVGGSGEIRVNVRIIASTNKDLGALGSSGKFRKDLYYRLNGVELTVPPLRERPEDIPVLVEHFLNDVEGAGKRFTANAMAVLSGYNWPGNVRELRNMVKATVLLNPGPELDVTELPRALLSSPDTARGRLERNERETIASVLDQVGGNRKAAARQLGISLRTLYYKLDRYGL